MTCENDDASLSTLDAVLRDGLRLARAEAHLDPFSNPILLQALALTRRIEDGRTSFTQLCGLIRRLTEMGFLARAQRLADYLGMTTPAQAVGELAATIDRLAGETVTVPFEVFRNRVSCDGFGVVMTGHPTFMIDLASSRLLARLASGELVGEGAQAEVARAPIQPTPTLTLEEEHAWSVEALMNAQAALEAVHALVLDIARHRYPDHWDTLIPRLVTFATWVGFDQDGRVDVTWQVSLSLRLRLKSAMTGHLRDKLRGILPLLTEPIREQGAALAEAMDAVTAKTQELVRLLAAMADGSGTLAEFASAFTEAKVPVDTIAWRQELAQIIAAKGQPEQARRDLLVIQSSLALHGLGLGHIHVRLNATQLHNAIRKEVGMQTSPRDPAHRRSYFNAINEMVGSVQPAGVSVACLPMERVSARRLFMTIALITRHVDSETPVRFLVAETESGFTLLAALYLARQFGVEDRIEISPLFETEEALERGEAVIEEALRSPHFRQHIRARGRLALQFGFSDSGRYLGQMAATFRIERLRLRIALLLERMRMTDVEVILFNTHGDSVGRGGHPATLADRLRYVAPPVSRAEFARRNIRVKEEVSFQGGDGFLPFLSFDTAFACLKGIITFALGRDPEADGDEIYEDPDFAAEFFATVQQRFTRLVENRDYAALISVYGPRILWRTGSRPVNRTREDRGGQEEITHPSQMRAIPNNSVLQQMGFMANTFHGVGAAIKRDPARFAQMLESSPRFRRAMALVLHARAASDFDVLRSYLAHFDPGMWLTRSGRSRDATAAASMLLLSAACERRDLHDRLARVMRQFQADYLDLTKAVPSGPLVDRETLILLHIIRLAIMQRMYMLATRVPEFSPQLGITWEEVLERVLHLDVPAVVEKLRRIFPREDPAMGAWVDPSLGALSPVASGYGQEDEHLFVPLLEHARQCLNVTTAITLLIGAGG